MQATELTPIAIETSAESIQPLLPYFRGFRRKLKIEFRCGDYVVKTAENEWEAQRALALRNLVNRESSNHRPQTEGSVNLDFEIFDHDCDHLIIIHEKLGRIVGTARLASSLHCHSFSSTRDFYLEIFLSAAGNKLECSRLCVDRSFRNGTVIALLMRGVSSYAYETNSKYVFGAIATELIEADVVVPLLKHMSESGVAELRFTLESRSNSRVPGLPVALARFARNITSTTSTSTPRLTGLLRFLTRMGAKVCLSPARDKENQLISFLSVLDFSGDSLRLGNKIERRFDIK